MDPRRPIINFPSRVGFAARRRQRRWLRPPNYHHPLSATTPTLLHPQALQLEMSDPIRNTVLRPRTPDIFPGSYAVGSGHSGLENGSPAYITARPLSIPKAHHDPASLGVPSEKTEDGGDGHIPREGALLAPSDSWQTALKDCFDVRLWTNRRLWSAGVSKDHSRRCLLLSEHDCPD